MKTPLSGSTTGRPITISDSVLTTVHASPSGQTSALELSILNTTGGAITVTMDVGGITATFSLAANAIEHVRMSIADADVLQMQGSAVGLRVIGTCESGHRQISAV